MLLRGNDKSYVTHASVCIWILVSMLMNGSCSAQGVGGLTFVTASWPIGLPTSWKGYYLNLAGGGCQVGDMNGDGAQDLICPAYKTSGGPDPTFYFMGNRNPTNGFTFTAPNGSPDANTFQSSGCAVADFDGDGRADLGCMAWQTGTTFPQSNSGNPSFAMIRSSDGTNFSLLIGNTNYYVPYQNISGPSAVYDRYTTPFGSSCTVGHFMAGPGQNIICAPSDQKGTTTPYYVYRFSKQIVGGVSSVSEDWGNGWVGPYAIPTWGTFISWGGQNGCLTGDFNGDGLTDIACRSKLSGSSNVWNVGLSTGKGFVVSPWYTDFLTDCVAADFNGDGKTDLACNNPNYGTYGNVTYGLIRVYLSTGSGFAPGADWQITNMPGPQNIGSSQIAPSIFASVCTVADLNGDGKSDIFCYSGSGSNWVYGLSTGSGFVSGSASLFTPPSVLVGTNQVSSNLVPFQVACTMGDFLGKGLPQLICPTAPTIGGYNVTPPNPWVFSVGIISRQ